MEVVSHFPVKQWVCLFLFLCSLAGGYQCPGWPWESLVWIETANLDPWTALWGRELHPNPSAQPFRNTGLGLYINEKPKPLRFLGLSATATHISQCMCVCTLTRVWFCHSMDCSPPGSSVHGILPARMLEWVAISFSSGCSQPRDRTHISCMDRQDLGSPLFNIYICLSWLSHLQLIWTIYMVSLDSQRKSGRG